MSGGDSGKRERRPVAEWDGRGIGPGQRKRLRIEVGESFSGSLVKLPLMVWRGPEEGPVLGITAAVARRRDQRHRRDPAT